VLTFVIHVLLFPLTTAIYVSIVWGFTLLCLFSFYIAKEQGVKPWKVVIEHLVIALVVIIITHYAGGWISSTFGC